MKNTLAPSLVPHATFGSGLSRVPDQPLRLGRPSNHTRVHPERILFVVAALAVSFAGALSVIAREVGASHWVGTWESSPQPIWGPDFIADLKYPRNIWNQTVRQVSRVSIGGSRIRVVLSNEYGEKAVTIGAAHVALADKGPAIVAGSDRPLTFGGRTTATIPAGAPVLSKREEGQ